MSCALAAKRSSDPRHRRVRPIAARVAPRSVLSALALASALISCGPKSAVSPSDAPRLEAGAPVWVQHFASDGHPSLRALAVHADGALIAVGAFQHHLRLADTVLQGAADDDVFVARLTKRGVLEWARAFGGAGIDSADAVAVAPGGDIVIAGAFHGTLTLGEQRLTAKSGAEAFVARLSADGEPRWARAFGGTGVAHATAIAIGADDAIYVAGAFDETVSIGGTELASQGVEDGFIARLDADGATVWARAIGGASPDALEALAVSPTGDVVVAGHIRGDLLLGSIVLDSSEGLTDALLAVLRGADGQPLWAQRFGGSGYDAAHAIAIDDDGDILLAATFDEPAVFGGERLEPSGDFDIALARFAASGEHRWSLRLGGDGYEAATHLAIAGHDIVLAGDFAGVAELGGTRLESAGRHDGFVARYSPQGSPLWARQLAGDGHDQLGAVVASAGGGVYVAGSYHRAAKLAGQELKARGAYELVLFELTQ